ncbi:MAG: phosphomannomutase [Armatimonadota bacterium]|jgi:phosphomannomutase|nr:phosphomannomutase [Armatimonadetes bacterium Uphvl-Ar2]MCE2939628.1 phosphomannomutase CpsG [Fimbriimonadaceae bacterium]MCZ8137914.1 phosphomannomutase CpsG [Fimbriimonadaceae bacterium]
MGQYFACFKAYDIRGQVPNDLNPELAYRVGRAFADETGSKSVCVGHDIRLSGPDLMEALTRGLADAGVDVIQLGLIGTEMVYFATAHYGYDGGVMITASHNPPQDNGMKMVRVESRPISSDTGLNEIERRAYEQKWEREGQGQVSQRDVYDDFIQHLLTFDANHEIKPLKVLASPGNGAAGVAMEKLMPHIPLQVERMMFEPDGHFPNGVPNPILPESRAPIEARLKEGGFDFGVAWDGDYDRCFFLTEDGTFIEGYYIVGLLAKAILQDNPGAAIVYDPRLTWNTLDIVAEAGGRAVLCKSGHAFIKEKMRVENAVYGGEMSAHHYFRDHWYCDSGMIPLMLVAKLVSVTGQSLGALVADMMAKYPCSGEINSTVADVKEVLARVQAQYADGELDTTDGISISYPNWRFNLRGSNTEPVIRLNVESRGDGALMRAKTDEVLQLVRQ